MQYGTINLKDQQTGEQRMVPVEESHALLWSTHGFFLPSILLILQPRVALRLLLTFQNCRAMRTVLFFAFCFFVVPVVGQDADSLAAAAQVDSLIKVSRDLTAKGAFDQALEVNAAAEKIALERFGRESAAYGSCCFNRGKILKLKGNYPEAEKWYLEAITIRGKVLGKEHPDYAYCLNNLANVYLDIGQLEKSEQFHLECKAIREKVLGKEHLDYAWSLNNLGNMYRVMRQYEKAELLHLECKAIREKVLGKEHLDYTFSLMNLANVYRDFGHYEKAEPLYLECKAIREKVLGKEHLDYAWCLYNLASQYGSMGQYEKAEPLFVECKAIFEKVLGKEHPDYAHCVNNLANVYSDINQFEKAEPLFLECIAIFEKVLGKQHPFYAHILANLAILKYNMGQYEKAELLHLEARAIRGKVLGNQHPDYAWGVGSLANLYRDMGQFEKAEPLFLECIAIFEKVLGKEHPNYALSLGGLASLYLIVGHYEKAEPLFLECIAILEKVLGKEHPNYAWNLRGLAHLYYHLGQYEKAVLVNLECKAIYEKALGKEHPSYAFTLSNLTHMYLFMGQYEKAERFQLECKAIYEKVLGREHPSYVWSLGNLANVYRSMGQYEKAEPLYLESSEINIRLIEKATLHLSERELNNYLNKFSTDQDQTFSCVQTAGNTVLIPTCYNNSLFFKGFLLQAARRLKQLALSDTAAVEKFTRLKGYHRRLAASYSLPKAERDSALVAQLETQTNDLEKNLARTVAGYGQAKQQVTWQDVKKNLKPGESSMEFVHYQYNDKKTTDSTIYAALFLRSDAEQPVFIPLFEEKSLDSLLYTRGERKADYVNGIYALPERGAKPLGKPQKTLYDLLWKPLEKELAGVKTIYFSPSGLLHRLNLAAIPINLDSVLGDRYNLVELGSTRQLVIPATIKPAANDALLFGGISYDSDSTALSQTNAALDSASFATRGELNFAYTDSSLRVSTWSALPYTEREVFGVAKTLKAAIFQTEIRRGFAATEEAIKTLGIGGKPSPRILHLATHGFFFPDPEPMRECGMQNATEPVFKLSDHPMIRSGLILAGANHAWATGKPLRPGMEDGILTAYEISQMNLSNTELVVLSACETGLGDIQGNEGVYGLQRAFKIAGAKYLIMSLWQVPDQETSVFMTAFYKHWLGGEMGIPEAFRTTQQEMRERFINPYQWAGFVLVE